ncbi:hypothetical protein FT641_27060 [Bacillus paranthracis]|uniref:hypothetical protein n=1 Tax=Bacillus paranthracis TaxID=2026186 RepID=UPI00187AEAA3|nr:hypothetical protein [Bacillus paranthracis]MBE7117313.1 hypothetical protein [Bacillus paranthracis]MBE7134927.1 hypothetical protein [Bacillus paranthracis]MBE7156336.1 hypothetical protein [Bacillus paranthracis]
MKKIEKRFVKVYDKKTGILKEMGTVKLPAMKSIIGFLQGEWNLDKYERCFEGSNRLGDIDASIEIAGHLLLIEFKESKHAINRGQILKAIRTAKYCKTTTMFVFGETNYPKEMIQFTPENPYGEGFEPTSIADLRKRLKQWHDESIIDTRVTDEDNQLEWKATEELLKAVGK